jgi:hypothetical protein
MLEGIATWLEALLKSAIIWLVKGVSLGVWYLEKVSAWVSEQIITSTIWETITNNILASLAASLPDTLRTVLFGAGGGLFYIALIGVSLMLVVPHLLQNGNQPVQFERVMGWSMLVVVMFISSTAGYDAIGGIEQLRIQTINGIVSGWGTGSVTDFVARPMSATAAEINVNEFLLPAAFATEYFPAPTAYEVVEIIFYDAPLLGSNSATVTVETDDSLAFRTTQATLGIVLAIVNLVPTIMVVILAMSFAALTASALVLILFFLLSIPVGLFEVGGVLLSQIASRYVIVWALSIFIATFPAMLLGVADLTLTPPVTLPDLFTYIAVLLVAVVAVQHVAKWVYQVAVDIFAGIGQTLNTTLMPQMYGGYVGPTPTPNQLPPAYANYALGAAALGGLSTTMASSQAGQVATHMVHGGLTAAGLGVGWAASKLTQVGTAEEGKSQANTQLVPHYAETAVAPPKKQPATHVFAYLDDPSVIEGEFVELESKQLAEPSNYKEATETVAGEIVDED